jgi:hypothetical protein
MNLVFQPEPLPDSPAFERHFSVAEISKAWSLSEDTVRRLFDPEPGIIVIAALKRRGKRAYRTIRIPQSIAERVYHRLQAA